MAQRPRPRPLDPAELDRQLADLPGVHRGAATTLVLAVRAPSFADAVRLVDLVAQDAEAMDHHPEVHLRLRVVTFTFTSNLEGAVTQWDVELAHRVLEAAGSVGAGSTSTCSCPPSRPGGGVQACIDAGGVLVGDAHAPDWWVLADPEGNE